ncbi:hypothetical protein DdX_19119 [Ditylenchus destructor]|uniref:Uncharacterized protein n=1 Tax=Ditylenchus destructor TaxID=166010 RepID=A0AAD4QXG5_9BILA|nr:hypothetical protein DdX_19119 [Ditylenchus destructor]
MTNGSFEMTQNYGISTSAHGELIKIYPFLVIRNLRPCMNSADLVGNALALRLGPMHAMEKIKMTDILIVMDLGMFNYTDWKSGNGHHVSPSLAIGGNLSCSETFSDNKYQGILVLLRLGTRIMNEAISDQNGMFYMQVYDERYSDSVIFNTASDLNLYFEHNCRFNEEKVKTVFPLHINKESCVEEEKDIVNNGWNHNDEVVAVRPGRCEVTKNGRATIRKADFAACPTLWVDGLDLKYF